MFNTLFGNLGQGIATSQQLSAQQAQQYPAHYHAQQSAMAQQQAQHMGGLANQNAYQSPKWMFDGVLVEFKDFVDLVFPEDTPEKTLFVLKYSQGESK